MKLVAAALLASLLGCNGQSSGYSGTGAPSAKPSIATFLTVTVTSSLNASAVVTVFDATLSANPTIYSMFVPPLGTSTTVVGPPVPPAVQVATPTWSRTFYRGPHYTDHLNVSYP